jgi:hypothetical protein
MNYPSLLYTKKPAGRRFDAAVFEDLKLNLLLSDEAIDAMMTPCHPDDIPVRQELFKLLQSESVREEFKRLANIAETIRRLSEAYKAVRCDNERNFVFVNLIGAVTSFYQHASAISGGGVLATRFRDFFRSESSAADYRRLSEEAGKLLPMNEKVRVNSFKMIGDDLYIRPEDDRPIVARLLKCAVDLGLTDSRETRDISIKLNPRLINAVASMHPKEFHAFKEFYSEFNGFFHEEIIAYRSELNFYLEVSGIFDRVRSHGIPICWPVASKKKQISAKGLRDLSLLAKNETNIVPNDILFNEEEPFFYLTGANGGGKTTYLRSVGIAVVLFLTGCPIPCETAEIYPLDCVYTHFPRDERFEGEGRFADEENRVKEILRSHAGNSLVLLNETYSTTSEELALKLTAELAETIYDSGSLGIYITHQHGIGETKIPFLSVIIDESAENRRTYKITRRRGASGSYAYDILKKYGLTAEVLKNRFSGYKWQNNPDSMPQRANTSGGRIENGD